ncbi:MAG: carbohydrate ABC transporter permease [Christensenellaceae bacterium]|jgi:raffinose/stachyose/melibiose transport system permease protein|nr:carbohydrate ABC transporter permease [Christensenellaceae bacterium]
MSRQKNLPFLVFCYALVALFLFLYLFPLFFSFNTSVKTTQEYLLNPTGLTQSWTFQNYVTAWNKAKFGNYILNSVLYTAICTLASLLMSLLIAFPIARKYVAGSNFLYFLFLCGLFLPSGTIPLFQIILKLGLYNTKPGYMLVMTGVSATSVFFFTGYFRSIPRDMDEAAAIDGCNYLYYVFRVIVPLAKPAIVSMGILSMIGVWNDIVSSTIYLSSEMNFNITRGLTVFTGQYSSDWTLTAAGLFIVAAPLIVTYLFAQRYIVDGVMAGGLKG